MTQEQSYYMIHDNGFRPFKVVVSETEIIVYRHRPYDGTDSDFDEDDEEQYDVEVHKIIDYFDIFIGCDPEHPGEPFYEGNTILVHVSSDDESNTYIVIEGCIYSFTVEDKIVKYLSPIGNSDVPYNYAIGQHYVYTTWENKYFPINVWDENDTPDLLKYEEYRKDLDTEIIIKRKHGY